MIGELEEATLGLSVKLSRSCTVSLGSPADSEEINQLDKEIQVLYSSRYYLLLHLIFLSCL